MFNDTESGKKEEKMNCLGLGFFPFISQNNHSCDQDQPILLDHSEEEWEKVEMLGIDPMKSDRKNVPPQFKWLSSYLIWPPDAVVTAGIQYSLSN